MSYFVRRLGTVTPNSTPGATTDALAADVQIRRADHRLLVTIQLAAASKVQLVDDEGQARLMQAGEDLAAGAQYQWEVVVDPDRTYNIQTTGAVEIDFGYVDLVRSAPE